MARHAAVALFATAPAWGQATAKHRFHQVRGDSVDLVMSVGWDYTDPASGGPDREFLEDGLRKFAETTHQATEGRLRVCKVYVYKKRNARLADIVFSSALDRANADLGGLRNEWGQIRMFRGQPSHPYNANESGVVLAHEFGHYGLFLKDEYIEPPSPSDIPGQYSPHPCDVTLPTLMGDHSFADMSLPKDYTDRDWAPWGGGPANKQQKYQSCNGLTPPAAGETAREDATFRTAQWRTYRMSAWDLIVNGQNREILGSTFSDRQRVEVFKALKDGGVPTKLKPPAYDGGCFQPIFLDGAFVVMMIDHSISMLTQAAVGGTYWDKAIGAALSYVASIPAGVTLTILEFGAATAPVLPATKFEKANLEQTRQKVLDTLTAFKDIKPSGNSTGLDQGMIDAFPIFINGSDVGNIQYALVISDGDTVLQDWIANNYTGINAPIFTIGTGSNEGAEVLQSVSQRTRGAYKTAPGWQHGQIEEELTHEEPLGLRTYPKPASQAPLEAPVEVSELDGATSFRGYFQGNSPAAFELTAPDGSVISPGALPPGISYESDEASATYLVAKPAAGKWIPRLVPQGTSNGDLRIAVNSASPLALRVDVRGGDDYPDPFIVRATLGAPQPVLGARVVGTFGSTAGPAPKEIVLLDDGVAPDDEAGDGTYTAVVHTLETEGKYELEVEATNPKLEARIDSSFVNDEPGEHQDPVPLAAFTRRGAVTLIVKHYRQMPQTPEGALQVRNDLTPMWVTINAPGDVVWLEFNGYKNGRYLAMTGDFYPHDDKPLTTRLSLYDTDKTTLLGSNAGADGRAQVPLDTPNVDGKYYLKVEHTGSGIGRLRVAVAPREWFATAGKKGSHSDSGSMCSFGPTDERAPLLPLALAGYLALVLRRARRFQRCGSSRPEKR